VAEADMRIALSVETFLPKIDGIVKIACLTLDHLKQLGIEMFILAPELGVNNYCGTPVGGVPSVVNPLYPEGRISLPTFSAYRMIRDFRPDLVHAIDPGFIGMAALLSAKYLRVPTVASYHLSLSKAAKDYGVGFMEQPIRAARIWGFNAVDHALAPSRQAQELLKSRGVRRVGWWRRGVNVEQFHPQHRSRKMRQKLTQGHADDTILIYVGRLAPEKRIHLLKPLLETIPRTRLALVGDGPQRRLLEQNFAGMPVTFTGYLNGDELAAAYASADIFVFTSHHESFGLVLAEAIASGLPVVSSRVGGAEDVIQHGETGYVFDVDDLYQFREYVCALVADGEKRRQMGTKARKFSETLVWEDIMRDLSHFYEDIIRERGHDPGFSPLSRPVSPMLVPKPR
jgi:glycosyltransferase involved in cell wall biosynthesis